MNSGHVAPFNWPAYRQTQIKGAPRRLRSVGSASLLPSHRSPDAARVNLITHTRSPALQRQLTCFSRRIALYILISKRVDNLTHPILAGAGDAAEEKMRPEETDGEGH